MTNQSIELPGVVRATVEKTVVAAAITKVEREKFVDDSFREANYRVITTTSTGRRIAVIVTPDGCLDHQVELRLPVDAVPAKALAAAQSAMGPLTIEKIACITYSGRDAYYRFSNAKNHWRVGADGSLLMQPGLK